MTVVLAIPGNEDHATKLGSRLGTAVITPEVRWFPDGEIYIRIDENDANVGHEASVSKVGEDQLFYLQAHGLDEEEASKMIVNGFIEPITKELPMEYAVEMNRLIELQMEGSIG